jgi:hypothetical protein
VHDFQPVGSEAAADGAAEVVAEGAGDVVGEGAAEISTEGSAVTGVDVGTDSLGGADGEDSGDGAATEQPAASTAAVVRAGRRNETLRAE